MPIARNVLAIAIGTVMSAAALGQGTATTVQRDVNQQQRIEQGLQTGQLTTGEAARLEKQETKVETMQNSALKDGTLTPAEQVRLQNAQNSVSADIRRQKHNARTGNPDSGSSTRMQADVQRNISQQARVEQGVKSRQLTNSEVARLERGQAHVTAKEAAAGANGRVGPAEQRNIQASENYQSARIYHKKHNVITKPQQAG